MVAGVSNDKENANELKRWMQTRVAERGKKSRVYFQRLKKFDVQVRLKTTSKPELLIGPIVSKASSWKR